MRRFLALALVALTLSCDESANAPAVRAPSFAVSTLPSVRISEFHYDNTGTDAGEAIEVSGPTGADVTGWKVFLYNGNGGATYTPTVTLSGTIPATCGTRGVIVTTYAVNGIQNGDPDGIALVDAAGSVVEAFSYEGSFTATNGPALGMVLADIGVREAGTEALGQSLKRNGAGVWSAPSASNFGSCNDNDEPPPPVEVASITVSPASATVLVGGTQSYTATAFDASNQPIAGTAFTWSSSVPAIATVTAAGVATGIAAGDATVTATAANGVSGGATLHVNPIPPSGPPSTRIAEIHYDNAGTDAGEAIEVEGPAGTSVTGWTVVLYNGNGGASYNTSTLGGAFNDQCGGRGTKVITYPQDGIQNGSPDGVALVNDVGVVVEFLTYEGTFTATNGPAAGMLGTDIGVLETSAPVGQSLQRNDAGAWSGPSANTMGFCNSAPPPPPSSTITFTGRLATDPPLPVGFEDQLFATLRDGSGQPVIGATFAWASETPATASIDANGVMHALAAGTATFRATAADAEHTTATYSLPMTVATASTTALYGNNTEFGDPTDGDPSDDFIVHRPEYTTSYSHIRNTPNWVSYDLEASHFGSEVDRCDCFTHDPALPDSFAHLTTADYTGAGAFAGYGIDRGHMTRSFDRTSGPLDNATTYYFSNVIPQAADLNQGPWAILENFLGDLARNQGKEVYIVTGPAGNKGSVKGEGKITIPTNVWKVAVILGHDQGLADVHGVSDLQVIAVITPNDPGVRNVDWHTYQTTVDAVEALSGYDLLSLLPDQVEIAIESQTQAPVAAVNGPYSSQEGSSVSLSGAASSDADGDALTYAWDFGDGSTGTGINVSHTYAQDGTYAVHLNVTDTRGLINTTTTTATVSNVAPVVGPLAGATLLVGETYSATGSFSDPGADSWTGSVNYGGASGDEGLTLTGMTFSLSHTYSVAGTYTVTVGVADDDAFGVRSQTVTVESPAQGVDDAMALLSSLTIGSGNSLMAKLLAARKQLEKGGTTPAIGQLGAFLNELDALLRSGRISASDAEALRVLVSRIAASLPV